MTEKKAEETRSEAAVVAETADTGLPGARQFKTEVMVVMLQYCCSYKPC